MNSEYADIIYEMSHAMFNAICEREPDLEQKVHELDSSVNKLLRRIGFQVVSMLLAQLSSQPTKEAKETGLGVQRRKWVKYLSLSLNRDSRELERTDSLWPIMLILQRLCE